MERVAIGQPLDRNDVGSVMAGGEREAGIDPPSVDKNSTRAALPAITALFGAGEQQPFAEQIEQRDTRIVEIDPPGSAVDGKIE